MGSRSITAIAELAQSKGGIVTTAEIVAAKLDPRVAERQVRAGNWQRPARGIYVPLSAELSGLDLGRVAMRLAGERVVISGLVPLRELGLRWLPADDNVLGLVTPQVRTPSSRRVVLRRTKDLDHLQTWWRGGVELAPVQRAVVDAARGTPGLRDVRGIVLGAVANGWADVDTLNSVLATTQQNGSGLTRRAVADARRGAASPPEAELVDELLGCGVPFYVNPELWLHGDCSAAPTSTCPGSGSAARSRASSGTGRRTTPSRRTTGTSV